MTAYLTANLSSDESQAQSSVKGFLKTQRGGINTLIETDGEQYTYNFISANQNRKLITLRCSHVKMGCSDKAKGS